MKPVDQIVFEDGKGDCLRACVASILGWSLESVPNFAEDGSYADGAVKWLKERGYTCLKITWTGEGFVHEQYMQGADGLYCILSGTSPRQTPEKRKQHAVVGKAVGFSFEIVHDPHPDRTGIVGEPFAAMWIFRLT